MRKPFRSEKSAPVRSGLTGIFRWWIGASLGAIVSLHAQTITTPIIGNSPATGVASPAPTITATSLSNQTAPALGLAWNEAQRLFTVSVSNPAAVATTVLGVQTTSGLYVVQFPTAIPASGSATFSLLYYSQAGTSASSDLLRVLTDQGLISVQVDHTRAPAATLGSTTLEWAQGEAANPKSVTLTMTAGTAVPTGAVALGSGNAAQVVSQGGGSYLVQVTPGSTAKPESFPVILQFQPAIPDTVAVITCTVSSN